MYTYCKIIRIISGGKECILVMVEIGYVVVETVVALYTNVLVLATT